MFYKYVPCALQAHDDAPSWVLHFIKEGIHLSEVMINLRETNKAFHVRLKMSKREFIYLSNLKVKISLSDQ